MPVSQSTAASDGGDKYLAIVTTEAHGVHEHKIQKSEQRPKPNEIVAEVAYSGLNHIDVGQVETGVYIGAFPFIIGKEWSGKVVEVGSDVKDLKAGDAVIGLGYKVGALQQRITVPRAHVCLKPDNLSFEEAATIPHRYAAIFVALFFKQGLQLPLEPSDEEKAKHHVIIWGAATGTGMFAIQTLKAQGYQKIIAVASLKKKDKLLAMGASDVFDRNDSQIATKIKAKYPDVSLGLACQIDPNGWTALLEVVKPDDAQKTTPAIVAHIIGTPSEVPKGVELRRTVAFVLVKDPMGDQVIAKYLPELFDSPTFQLPKAPEVVSKESLLESTKGALEIARKNTDVSVVIKVN